MRLVNFLSETFDYINPTFKITNRSSSGIEGSFEVFNRSLNETFIFDVSYPYNETLKWLSFGFTRKDVHPSLMYFATRDWKESPLKVFSGVLQGIPEAIKTFSDAEKLIGTALIDDRKESVEFRTNLEDIYRSRSFIKAVEKWSKVFKFSHEEKNKFGDCKWIYIRRK